MLKIRMQRVGRINVPSYRIIVVEHTESPKTGNVTDVVGTYNPKNKVRTLDEGKIKHWISVGAQPSATVHNMLVSAGILNAKKINVLPKYKEPVPADAEAMAGKKEEAAPADSTSSPQVAEEVKEETKAEVPAETPAQ
jgi:small subunit ribosomal protein S16